MVKKWQTLIEAFADIKTTDGYLLRLFLIGFTRRRPNQVRKTTYAQSAQIRQIRKRMVDIMKKETETCSLKEFVQKLIPEVIGREVEKSCSSIYPLQSVYVRKVKILKAPIPRVFTSILDPSQLWKLNLLLLSLGIGRTVTY